MALDILSLTGLAVLILVIHPMNFYKYSQMDIAVNLYYRERRIKLCSLVKQNP